MTTELSPRVYSFATESSTDDRVSALSATIARNLELRNAGLVSVLRRRLGALGGVQQAHIVTARLGADLAGYALVSNRPLAAYTKIIAVGEIEHAAEAGATRRALVAHIRDEAFAGDCVAVKWQIDADDATSASLARDLGFAELPSPLVATPVNADDIADGSEDNSADYPSTGVPTPRGFVLWRQTPKVAPALGYWRQTTRFTCGPVALLVARALLQDGRTFTRADYVALWRDATSGQGSDPIGLALSAARQGLNVELVMTDLDPDARDRSRPASVREVRRFFQHGFRSEAVEAGVAFTERAFTIDTVREAVEAGQVVLLLIDILLQRGHHGGHWVVVYGFHDGVFLVEDSATAWADGETWVDLHQHPVPVDTLDRQAWCGKPGHRAMIILRTQAGDGSGQEAMNA